MIDLEKFQRVVNELLEFAPNSWDRDSIVDSLWNRVEYWGSWEDVEPAVTWLQSLLPADYYWDGDDD